MPDTSPSRVDGTHGERGEHTARTYRLPRAERRKVADACAVDAVTAALSRTVARHRVEAPRLPVVIAAADYCAYAAEQYVAKFDTPTRRLLPSDSLALEPSGLLKGFAASTGWRGVCHIVTSPSGAAAQARGWAIATVGAAIHSAVLLCEVSRGPDGAFHATAELILPQA